jgi:hypothetical protein
LQFADGSGGTFGATTIPAGATSPVSGAGLTWDKTTYTLKYVYNSGNGTFTLGSGATLTNGAGTTYNSILAVEAASGTSGYFGALISSAGGAAGLAVGNRGTANALDFYKTRLSSGSGIPYGANAYQTSGSLGTTGVAINSNYFNDAGTYAVTAANLSAAVAGAAAWNYRTNSTAVVTFGELATGGANTSNVGAGVVGAYYPVAYSAGSVGLQFFGGFYDGLDYYGSSTVAYDSSGYVISLTYEASTTRAGEYWFFSPTSATNANAIAKIRLATSTGYGSYIDVGTHYPFTGSHEVLTAPNQGLEIGDIVVCTELVAKKDINNAMVMVAKSSAPNQKSVLGVVSLLNIDKSQTIPTSLAVLVENASTSTIASPITTLNPQYQAVYDANELTGINAIGEGLINVCGEGGNIEIGDYITSSSTPGKGMKQADDLLHNYTVAKAREAYTFTSNEIVQIACTYHCG